MQYRHVTLYIPGLLGNDVWREPAYFRGLQVAELELLLSRGRHIRHSNQSFESALFRLFGVADVSNAIPVASVTHFADQGEHAPGVCLRADPVHLQADRDRIVMFGNQHLAVTAAEASQLAGEFNRLFAEDGLRLETPQPQR